MNKIKINKMIKYLYIALLLPLSLIWGQDCSTIDISLGEYQTIEDQNMPDDIVLLPVIVSMDTPEDLSSYQFNLIYDSEALLYSEDYLATVNGEYFLGANNLNTSLSNIGGAGNSYISGNSQTYSSNQNIVSIAYATSDLQSISGDTLLYIPFQILNGLGCSSFTFSDGLIDQEYIFEALKKADLLSDLTKCGYQLAATMLELFSDKFPEFGLDTCHHLGGVAVFQRNDQCFRGLLCIPGD